MLILAPKMAYHDMLEVIEDAIFWEKVNEADEE